MQKRLYLSILRAKQRMGAMWPILVNGIALTVVFILGSLAYVYVEGWSFFDGFYMVLITLATIGFGEVHPLSDAGKWVTIIVILSGIIYFALLIGYCVQIASDGRLFHLVRRRRVYKAIGALSGHCVLCGFGILGRVVARELVAEGLDVVVIESDDKKSEDIESMGCFHVIGDATSDEVLSRVGIGQAKALITAMTKDPANVYVVLSARALNPSLYIVSYASDNSHISKLRTAGANSVVLPHVIGGLSMARAIQRPTVESFLNSERTQDDEVQLDELHVTDQAPFVGQTLQEVALGRTYHVNIVAFKAADGASLKKAHADTVLSVGDTLLVAGAREHLLRLRAVM